MLRLPGLSLPLAIAIAVVPASGLQMTRPGVAAGVPSLPATTVSRLRANGLDPADPQLHAKLLSLASRRPPVLAPSFFSRFQEPEPLRRTEGTAQYFKAPILAGPILGHIGIPSAPAPVLSSVVYPYSLQVGAQETPIFPGFPTVVLAYGSCGTTTDLPDSEEVQYFPGSTTASIDAYVVTRVQNQWVTPVVAKDTPATMAVQFGTGPLSNAIPFVAQPTYSTGSSVYSQPIGDAAPFLSAGGPLALTSSAFASVASPAMASSAQRVSTNVTDPTQTGTDTIGYGVNLVNGWQATATITDVHSYQDAPGDSGSNDAFRSATVSQQPQSGRLETKVSWSYEGGESISYNVQWTFTKGVVIARVADTAPKLTTCAGEQ